jgi:hypothetical protein
MKIVNLLEMTTIKMNSRHFKKDEILDSPYQLVNFFSWHFALHLKCTHTNIIFYFTLISQYFYVYSNIP